MILDRDVMLSEGIRINTSEFDLSRAKNRFEPS